MRSPRATARHPAAPHDRGDLEQRRSIDRSRRGGPPRSAALVLVGDGAGDRGHRPGGRSGSAPRDPRAAPVGDGLAWVAVTRTGTMRVVADVATVVLLGLVILVVLTAEGHGAGPPRRARAARRVHRPRPLRATARSQGAASAAAPRSPGGSGRARRPPDEPAVRRGEGRAVRARRGVPPPRHRAGGPRAGGRPARARPECDRPWGGRDRHGRRGRIAGAGRQRGDGGRCSPRVRPRRYAQPLRPRPRPGPQRVVAALDAFARRRRAAHRSGHGERAGLREQRVPRRVRQDRRIAGVPRRQAADDHRDAVRSGGSASGALRPPPRRPRWHPSRRRADHPGVQQPLPADVRRWLRQPGPPRHRRARCRGGRPPRRPGHRRLPRRPVDGPPRPVPTAGRAGRPTRSRSSRADRSRRGWTARPCCSTRRSSSAACPAPSGSASPPRRPATRRPPSTRPRRGGR